MSPHASHQATISIHAGHVVPKAMYASTARNGLCSLSCGLEVSYQSCEAAYGTQGYTGIVSGLWEVLRIVGARPEPYTPTA